MQDHASDFWDLGKFCRIRSVTSETYSAREDSGKQSGCGRRRLGNVRELTGQKLFVPFSIQPEKKLGCGKGYWDRRRKENIVWTFMCDALEIGNLVNKSYTSPPIYNKRIHNGFCNGYTAERTAELQAVRWCPMAPPCPLSE
jgi:hypothetical protein